MRDEKIQAFALANNMEIIGQVVEEDNEKIKLKNTFALNAQPAGPDPSAGMQLQLVPPTFFGEDPRYGVDICIYKANILFTYTIRDDIYQGYCKRTSNIIVAGAGGIIH